MNPPFIHYDISLSIQEKSYEKKNSFHYSGDTRFSI